MVTRTLNLSMNLGEQSGFDICYETGNFPQGEIFFKMEGYNQVGSAYTSKIRVNSRCNSSDDLMRILMTLGAIKHNCDEDVKVELFIPYLPYSRQDRICKEGEAFSLKVLSNFFNSLKLDKLITYDVHSNISEILFDNFTSICNDVEVREFLYEIRFSEGREGKALISPDAGASKKSQALYSDNLHIFDTLIHCNKERRTDGSITIGDIKHNIRDMDVLVVDDICDGGATFIELGKRLKEAHVKSASLFVSHGIFGRGCR